MCPLSLLFFLVVNNLVNSIEKKEKKIFNLESSCFFFFKFIIIIIQLQPFWREFKALGNSTRAKAVAKGGEGGCWYIC